MKTIFFSFLIVLLPLAVFAQNASQQASQDVSEAEEKQPTYEEYSPDAVPEGMEVVSVTGGYKLIVPKGSKLRKVGAQIIVEGQKEYMSRNFEEMGKRLDEMTATIEELKEEINEIKSEKQEVSNLPDAYSNPPDSPSPQEGSDSTLSSPQEGSDSTLPIPQEGSDSTLPSPQNGSDAILVR